MKQTSKTGLTASPTKSLPKFATSKKINLRAIAKPAPYCLKPYSGLFNPYSSGCSLLCNHPMDKDTKDLLQRAKKNWSGDVVLLSDRSEVADSREISGHMVESVPEELFRRYTDTDSRPLTPAPTLASAATRASGSRRCVTPEARTKAQLILYLRRTHSQETMSYSASLQEPLSISIQPVPTKAASFEEVPEKSRPAPSSHSLPVHSIRKNRKASENVKLDNLALTVSRPDDAGGVVIAPSTEVHTEVEDDEYIKRRGKKKKKRKKERDGSRGPPAFHVSLDPETQVAATGNDMSSTDPTARNCANPALDGLQQEVIYNEKMLPRGSLDIDSYLDKDILRQLRRELNEEIVDNELDFRRRKALEEALKSVSKRGKRDCVELVNLQNELKLPPLNVDLWISLPRTFTRSSARFELPMNSRSLHTMAPLDYVRDHVSISSERKLLFSCIFTKFKVEPKQLMNDGDGITRLMPGRMLQEALDVLMGRPMTQENALEFRSLLDWKDERFIDFKTFSGIAALCERIMAPRYCPKLLDRKSDPCHEIETADFEALDRKLGNQVVDEHLVTILRYIKIL